MDDGMEKQLPRGVALSWGLVEPPKRGPKRELSIKEIVNAAIEIADKDGLSAVSMNRVASSLGFTAMSLYRYIPSKDDLILLMQDAVCDIPIPPKKSGKEWREALRVYVKACIKVFRDHPWFGDTPIFGTPITPNNLQVIDWVLREMRDLPLNDYEKMSFILLLSGYARSTGILERDMDRALQSGSSEDAFSGRAYTAALKQLVTPDRFPYLYQLVDSGVYTEENTELNNVGNDLDFGLERILDSIETYIKQKETNDE
ncbi:TetR/AcrR family transcriptional regulator [Camelliibacillus cellulosilyticus]|uniref:TetR/AcrR family transcriptional regulator n=1 Tax=Camelliibacillus cellulosilyticus TaxID=2174486 RepID=A0ABV9GN85_9BACL